MSKAGAFITFAMGAAIGSVATWYYCKKRYENLIQEEIDSVKEVFSKRFAEDEKDDPLNNIEEGEPDSETPTRKPSVKEYAAMLRGQGYTNYATVDDDDEEDDIPAPTERDNTPYIIPPNDLGERDGFDVIEFRYYSDGVLVDDNYDIVHDVENTIGEDSLTHFGEYEADSVCVRNERLGVDYEILRDLGTYDEYLEKHPYKAGV